VPLGISADEFVPRSQPSVQPFTVGYLGRIAPEKGVHLLCDAYHRLREQNEFEECRLELAGYLGPEHRGYLEGITRQINEWGLQHEIRYRGPLEFQDKVSFFQELDLFVVPATYDDPKGLALLEAMACGVPVIAANRGTYTEFIERTGGGVLVPPEDPESLMAELIRLRNDNAGRAALGESGSLAVQEHYSADAMAVRALDVYSRLHAGSN